MMNKEWQEFLSASGARLVDGVVADFGDEGAELLAARDDKVICDLGQFGVLRVSGADAKIFLQNLLSNDIGAVTQTRAQVSSLNSPKGRMLASLLVWSDGDSYFLQLPHALCDPIRKKLGMYVLRSKVTIADASEEIVLLGLSGANEDDLPEATFGELPQTTYGVTRGEYGSLINVATSRWQIATAPQYAAQFWDQLRPRFRPAGSKCWDWLTIRAGVPVISAPTQEQFVAQMVNFDLIDGVSFTKGCYPGQEIVARTHYLGKQKRRMYLAHLDSPAAPLPGEELFSDDMNGQPSGMIVNAAASPSGGFDVLAVAQISSVEAHPVHVGSLQGAPLAFQSLPYAPT